MKPFAPPRVDFELNETSDRGRQAPRIGEWKRGARSSRRRWVADRGSASAARRIDLVHLSALWRPHDGPMHRSLEFKLEAKRKQSANGENGDAKMAVQRTPRMRATFTPASAAAAKTNPKQSGSEENPRRRRLPLLDAKISRQVSAVSQPRPAKPLSQTQAWMGRQRSFVQRPHAIETALASRSQYRRARRAGG